MVAIVATILCPSCSQWDMEAKVRYVTVLQDITDEHIAMPKPDRLISELELDADSWLGIEFRYGFVSDVEYNTEYVLALPSENSWTGNEFSRKKKIETFSAELEEILLSLKIGKKMNSVVFPVVIREVNRLARIEGQNTGKKTLFVFSDLVENASGLHFHKRKWERDDTVKTAKIWHDMESLYGVELEEDLSGINVHFLYQAKGFGDSKRFSGVSNMYRHFLESHGATVTIAANL